MELIYGVLEMVHKKGKMIRSYIIKLFPDDGIIGEVFKEKKTKNKNYWIIDPIDGTKAFVAGLPTWSNLVGMMY